MKPQPHVYAAFTTNHPYSDASLERYHTREASDFNLRKELAHQDRTARHRRMLNSRGRLLKGGAAPAQKWS